MTPCGGGGGSLGPAQIWLGVVILEKLQNVCTVDGQGVTHVPEAFLGTQGQCRAFSNRWDCSRELLSVQSQSARTDDSDESIMDVKEGQGFLIPRVRSGDGLVQSTSTNQALCPHLL